MEKLGLVILSFVIHFGVPPITESKRCKVTKATESCLQIGFRFNYYQGESLREDEVNYRIIVIYVLMYSLLQ